MSLLCGVAIIEKKMKICKILMGFKLLKHQFNYVQEQSWINDEPFICILSVVQVIGQKRVRVLHQGFQTPRNR